MPRPSRRGKVTLRDVLRRDWFELWYQPKIDLRSKRLVGAEALVRGAPSRRQRDHAAGAFLPGAPEDDMLALTERVILTALRDFEDCAVLRRFGEAFGQCAGVGVRQAADRAMLREERPPTPNWPGLILEVTEDEIAAAISRSPMTSPMSCAR